MLSAGKRWLVHASQPHLPIHALFSVPNVLAYNTREAPCSSLAFIVKRRRLGVWFVRATDPHREAPKAKRLR